MAKKFYAPMSEYSKQVKKFYAPVNGISKKVKKGYCSVNGVSKLFYVAGRREYGWRQETGIPYVLYQGSAVVFQNKIHLLGGYSSRNSHYTWDGITWQQESNLPFSFYNGSAITFDGKIHCFGGNGTESQYYTYDGSTWTHEADLPDTWTGAYSHHYIRIQGLNHATIYNGKLTLACSNFGSNGDWRHIATLNNGSWSVNWTVLGSSVMYSVVGYNNLIYLLGDSGTSGTKYNTWDGNTQSAYNPLPIRFAYGYALEHEGKIHLLGGNGSQKNHYSFDGSTFVKELDIPYSYYDNCPAVVYKNRIHIFGGSRNDVGKQHWSYGIDRQIYSTLYPNANVYDAGTVAQTNGRRSPVTKRNDGDSIVFISKNATTWDNKWIYTCCIALTYDAAVLDAPNEGLNVSTHIINGTTYYFSLHTGHPTYDGATQVTTPIGVPVFDELFICNPNTSPTTQRVAEIIQMLGITT